MDGRLFSQTVIIIFLVLLSELTQGMEEGTTFMDSILNHTTYDRRLRPYYQVAPLNVTVGLTIVSFEGVGEVDGEFTIDLFLRQLWHDPRLRHNESHPHTLLGLDKNMVWLPDTFFLNIKKGHMHRVPSDNSQVQIWADGNILYSTRITLTAGCEMELSSYPLDTQTCELRIMSYANPVEEITYEWATNSREGLDLLSASMAQFEVTQIERQHQVTVLTLGLGSYSELVVRFVFKRRLGYSLLQIYAPTFLVVALSWLSFWISKDAIPARVALGATTVLTIVTLNGSLRTSVPKVSYIKALDWYLIVSFLFVFAAVLEYVTVLMAVDYHDYERHHGDSDIMAQCSDIAAIDHLHGDENETEEHTTKQRKKQTEMLSAKDSSNQSGCSVLFLKLNEILSMNSTPIDKASKVIFPGAYLLFNAVYWLVYCL